MSIPVENLWVRRYEEALAPGEIRRRAETHGTPIVNTRSLRTESDCEDIRRGLEAVNLVTAQAEAIIRGEIERAISHAKHVYSSPHAILSAAYGEVSSAQPYMPTFITGLAGVGKSRIRLSIRRVLSGNRTVCIDESHPSVPLIDYAECTIGHLQSVVAVLRQLAGPEIAAGRVKADMSKLSTECMRWQRVAGTCIVGVEEMQFMAQSPGATTLITRTLLAIADVGVPWFVTANYSLGWKLLKRPSEATQRLLGRPTVLYPDAPDSSDWLSLLGEYQVVLEQFVEFDLAKHNVQLWNLCAGLKRELVKLLLQAYRVAREAGLEKIAWSHVQKAFESLKYDMPRRDTDLLIAHAGQGGSLRKDLACPFQGAGLTGRKTAYAEQLRAARQSEVGLAQVKAAMNAQERSAVSEIQATVQADKPTSAAVVPMPRRKRKSLEGLIDAGRSMRKPRGAESDKV